MKHESHLTSSSVETWLELQLRQFEAKMIHQSRWQCFGVNWSEQKEILTERTQLEVFPSISASAVLPFLEPDSDDSSSVDESFTLC